MVRLETTVTLSILGYQQKYIILILSVRRINFDTVVVVEKLSVNLYAYVPADVQNVES